MPLKIPCLLPLNKFKTGEFVSGGSQLQLTPRSGITFETPIAAGWELALNFCHRTRTVGKQVIQDSGGAQTANIGRHTPGQQIGLQNELVQGKQLTNRNIRYRTSQKIVVQEDISK
jgi:hypothetical protein